MKNKKLLVKVIKRNYNLKHLNLRKVSMGYTNQIFYGFNKNEKYIIRLSPFYKIKHLSLELYVLKKLEDSIPLQVPHPLRSKFNTYCVRLGNYIISVFRFIEGEPASLLSRNLKIHEFSKELGKTVGILHKGLSKIKAPLTSFTHQSLITSYYDQFKFYTICRYHPFDEWRKLLIKKIEIILRELNKYKNYYDNNFKKTSIIHTDIRLDNIIIQNDKITGIIDFDDIMIGDEAFDLASMLVEIYSNKKLVSKNITDMVDLENFSTMVKEYQNERGIKRKKIFIKKIINFIELQVLQVLSIVGRDIEFDENQRMKNVIWYLNFLEIMNNKKEVEKIRNFLLND
jgi:Ser/Thr protein kinase RdoA (MazF antagonist)